MREPRRNSRLTSRDKAGSGWRKARLDEPDGGFADGRGKSSERSRARRAVVYDHRAAISSRAARSSRNASSRQRPASCKPNGKPMEETPQGSDSAG